MTIKKRIVLLRKNKNLYVQRPTSWIGGWARHLMLERVLKTKVTIASPDFWKELESTAQDLVVECNDDGEWKVLKPDKK